MTTPRTPDPSRYADFEKDDTPDMATILRRPEKVATPATGAAAAPSQPSEPPAPPDAADLARTKPAAPSTPAKKATPRSSTASKRQPQKPAAAAEATEKMVPSVIYIKPEINTALREVRAARGWSNGQVVLAAVSQTYQDGTLADRLSARAVVDDLFGSFTTRTTNAADEPKTPLNVRLRRDHYETLDRLVGELGAVSRSHLAATALEGYLTGDTK